jgi:hypothetical protein
MRDVLLDGGAAPDTPQQGTTTGTYPFDRATPRAVVLCTTGTTRSSPASLVCPVSSPGYCLEHKLLSAAAPVEERLTTAYFRYTGERRPHAHALTSPVSTASQHPVSATGGAAVARAESVRTAQ